MREYVLRYYSRAGEGVKRFTDNGGSDLDLRSGDIFYLAYTLPNEEPNIIYNVTRARFVLRKNYLSYSIFPVSHQG